MHTTPEHNERIAKMTFASPVGAKLSGIACA
jgi:hypothetical protein